MKTFKQYISELFDNPLPFKETSKQVYQFRVKGHTYTARFNGGELEFWDEDGDQTATGIGHKEAIQIFSTVYAILADIIKKRKVRFFNFSADKSNGESRTSLYTAMAKKISKNLSYKFRVRKSEEMDVFYFTRVEKQEPEPEEPKSRLSKFMGRFRK